MENLDRKTIISMLQSYEKNSRLLDRSSNDLFKVKEASLNDVEIEEVGKEVDFIEELLSVLDDNERELLKLKYIENKNIFYIGDYFYISKSTLYRRLSDIFDKMISKSKERI